MQHTTEYRKTLKIDNKWVKPNTKILKEYSDETLNIFWKSPYRKIYEFLKWNNWKIHFFFLFRLYFWFL